MPDLATGDVPESALLVPGRASSDMGAMSVRLVWLQRAGLAVLLILLALLAREAATHSIDFPVYHHAARQVIAGHYELYPIEAYGGTPRPSQGFRYAPAIAFLFVPLGWLPLELAALAFFALKIAAAVVRRRDGCPPRWSVGRATASVPHRIPDRRGIHRRGIALRQRPFPGRHADGVRLRQSRSGVRHCCLLLRSRSPSRPRSRRSPCSRTSRSDDEEPSVWRPPQS